MTRNEPELHAVLQWFLSEIPETNLSITEPNFCVSAHPVAALCFLVVCPSVRACMRAEALSDWLAVDFSVVRRLGRTRVESNGRSSTCSMSRTSIRLGPAVCDD